MSAVCVPGRVPCKACAGVGEEGGGEEECIVSGVDRALASKRGDDAGTRAAASLGRGACLAERGGATRRDRAAAAGGGTSVGVEDTIRE